MKETEMARIVKQMNEKIDSVAPAIDSVKKWADEVRPELIENFVNSLNGSDFLNSTYEAAQTASLFLQNAVEEIDSALKEIERWELDRAMYFEICLEFGWPPPLALDAGEVRKIVRQLPDVESSSELSENLDADDRAKFEEVVLGAYDEGLLNRMLNQWVTHSAVSDDESAILRDIVAAHHKGMYSLTVPALAPRIEALLATAYHHEGYLGQSNVQEYIDRLFTDENFDCAEELSAFLDNHYFARFKHGDPVEAELSRHAIVHGGDSEYASKSKSLRAILLFDFIISAINLVGNREEEVFHTLDCDCTEAIDPEQIVFYALPASAFSSEFRPCEVCMPDVAKQYEKLQAQND